MKGHLLIRLLGCALGACFIAPAFANHKTGDYPLPDAIAMGDFDQDGKLDLAVNISGFDTIAILTGDGQGGFTLKGHVETTIAALRTALRIKRGRWKDFVAAAAGVRSVHNVRQ